MEKNEIPKEQIDLLDFIIRSLNTALKNSTLYPADHPVFELSANNLRTSLENWFKIEEELIIGITQNNFLINNKYVRDESGVYSDVAGHLHRRGIAALLIDKEIKQEELEDFLVSLKEKKETMFERISLIPHIHIEALDYSVLLGIESGAVSEREEELWRSLCDITDKGRMGRLPESKEEFLKQFLRDPDRSAELLDKIYRQAMAGASKVSSVEGVRETIARIALYFGSQKTPDARSARKALADIIAQLDPDLVMKVMQESEIDGRTVDVAKEVTRDFSDEMLSEFISALIEGHGGINENLLKIFEKMVPQGKSMANVAALSVEGILQKGIDKDSIEQLQLSMKEMAKRHPGSDLVSQLYKRTLDTFASKKAAAIAKGRLAPLINEFKKSLTREKSTKDKAKLLLDLIWLEEKSEDFVRLTGKLMDHIPDMLDSGDAEGIRNVMELFGQEPCHGLENNEAVKEVMNAMNSRIRSEETAGSLIRMIPEKEQLEAEHIAYFFLQNEPYFRKKLVNAFLKEDDPFAKDRFVDVFMQMKEGISDQIVAKMESEDFEVLRSLFKVLKAVDPERASREAIKLYRSKDPNIRLEAVSKFLTAGQADIDGLLKMYMSERDAGVRNNLLYTLVRIASGDMVARLFKSVSASFRTRGDLLRLVKACGDNKMVESVPHLEKVVFRRVWFNSSRTDELKIAAVVSLGQIRTPESVEVVRKSLAHKREAVKKMAEIVLRMAEKK